MNPVFLRESPQGVVLALRVVPRSSVNAVAGIQGDALKVRITAPPVDAAANTELIRFLAELLGVPRGTVQLLRGGASRHKQVLVAGQAAARVIERLKPFIGAV